MRLKIKRTIEINDNGTKLKAIVGFNHKGQLFYKISAGATVNDWFLSSNKLESSQDAETVLNKTEEILRERYTH